MKHRFSRIALVAVVLTSILLPTPSQAIVVPVESLPPAQIVSQTRAEVLELGCSEGSFGDGENADVPPGKPYRVATKDRPLESIAYCSPTAAAQLTPVEGEVAGAGGAALVCGAILSARAPVCFTYTAVNNYFDGAVTESIVSAGANYVAAPLAAKAVQTVAPLISAVGLEVLNFSLQLLVFSLATPTFITNELVQIGWPFVQGIANLGFMLALLFIAFATTLRIQGFSPARQLPRLLIAAILINFSLIIAGVIIDITRVVMSIIVNTLGDTSLDQLPAHMLSNSGLVDLTAGLKSLGFAKYDAAISALFKAVIIWTLALSFLTIALTLLVRYIVLILLLIISPIAYLSFALPNTEPYAKQWWQVFFKYVFAGPIALFFLILAINVNSLGIQSLGTFGGTAGGKVVQAVVLAAMLVIAAVASLKMADKGSSAAVNRFSSGMKRAGIGTARYAGRRAGRAVRGRASEAGAAFDTRMRGRTDAAGKAYRAVRGAKRDASGKVIAGQAPTIYQKAGKGAAGVGTRDRTVQRASNSIAAGAAAPLATTYAGPRGAHGSVAEDVRRTAMKDVLNNGTVDPATGVSNRDTFSANNLKKPGVLKAMHDTDENSVKAIVEVGDRSQVKEVFKNEEFMSGLSDDERNELVVALEANVTFRSPAGGGASDAERQDKTGVDDAKAKSDLLDVFDKTIQAIEKKKGGGGDK